jgi:hypothetical protein
MAWLLRLTTFNTRRRGQDQQGRVQKDTEAISELHLDYILLFL